MLLFIQTKKHQWVFGRGSGRDHVDAILKLRSHYCHQANDIRKISRFLDAVHESWNPFVDAVARDYRKLEK